MLTDAGCNAGYWNLHAREISRSRDGWKSNDRPLVFYHFSDFRPRMPDVISGHQSRFDIEKLPDLKELFGIYASRLLENGDEECRHWEYGFSRYLNGKKIRAGARRAYLLNPQFMTKHPFDYKSHTLGFRLGALRQSMVLLATKGIHRFIRRR
jgi:hypothetical protein